MLGRPFQGWQEKFLSGFSPGSSRQSFAEPSRSSQGRLPDGGPPAPARDRASPRALGPEQSEPMGETRAGRHPEVAEWRPPRDRRSSPCGNRVELSLLMRTPLIYLAAEHPIHQAPLEAILTCHRPASRV